MRIFGPKRDEVEGGWRRLHSEELHNLYAPTNTIIRVMKSRRMTWKEHVARMREMKNGFKIMDGIPDGKRALGKYRSR